MRLAQLVPLLLAAAVFCTLYDDCWRRTLHRLRRRVAKPPAARSVSGVNRAQLRPPHEPAPEADASAHAASHAPPASATRAPEDSTLAAHHKITVSAAPTSPSEVLYRYKDTEPWAPAETDTARDSRRLCAAKCATWPARRDAHTGTQSLDACHAQSRGTTSDISKGG